MMTESQVSRLQTDLLDISDVVTKSSESALHDQEERLFVGLNEITQNIVSMLQESSYTRLFNEQDDSDELPENALLNPRMVQIKAAELETIIHDLKAVHIQQETLDYFLRYTISSASPNSMLQLESEDDPKFQEMKYEVEDLERKAQVLLDEDIDLLQKDISETSDTLAKLQDDVNETYLEITNEINECMDLMQNLDNIRGQKIASGPNTKMESNTQEPDGTQFAEIVEEWRSIKALESRSRKITHELDQLKDLKRFLNKLEGPKDRTGTKGSTESSETLQKLIQRWEVDILVKGVEYKTKVVLNNFDVYPRTRKIQFQVNDTYIVLITLGSYDRLLSDIEIYRKNSGTLLHEEDLKNQIKSEILAAEIGMSYFNMIIAVISMLPK